MRITQMSDFCCYFNVAYRHELLRTLSRRSSTSEKTQKAKFDCAPPQTAQDRRRGDAHIVGYYVSYVRYDPANLYIRNILRHQDGAKHDKGPERPSKTPALFPLPQKRCIYYSGIGPGQSEDSEPRTVGVVGALTL